ncbi:MAG: hypothetical protein ACFE9X_03690 [Promethearchaeota archaeon]
MKTGIIGTILLIGGTIFLIGGIGYWLFLNSMGNPDAWALGYAIDSVIIVWAIILLIPGLALVIHWYRIGRKK